MTLPLLALAGCVNGFPVSGPGSERLAAGNGDAQTSNTPAGESSPSFSKEVLYTLLVAEFAGRRGQLELSVSNYLDAARTTRDPGVAERATRVAVFARDDERGVEAAKLWVEVDPQSVDAKHFYATLLMRDHRTEEAVEQLQALIEIWNEESPGRGFDLVSDMLGRSQDKEAALKVMEQLVEGHSDDPDALFALATLSGRVGEVDKAVELLDRVRELDPDNNRAVIFHASLLRSEGNTAQALEVLREALERDPNADEVRTTYARLLVDAKRYAEARSQFERLVERSPDDVDIRYALALLLLQTEHTDEARTQFLELTKSGNRKLSAYFYLGQIAETEDDFEAAIEAYHKVDRGENYLNAQIRIAVLLAEQGKLDEAREYLYGVESRNVKEAVRVYRAEAEILTNADRLNEAIEVYSLALDEFPENSDLLYARAMLAEKLDRLDVLEADLRSILSREPNNAEALNALGYTLADRTDRYDEALELIKQALALQPDDYYIVDSMGWVMYRMGRHQESIEHLRRAMTLSDDSEIAAHLGEVLWVTGDKQEAQEIWNTALESTPDDERLLDVIKRFSE